MVVTYEVLWDIDGPEFKTKQKLESVLTSGHLLHLSLLRSSEITLKNGGFVPQNHYLVI
jgi:hypothetical protein